MGEHYANFRGIVEAMLSRNALKIVQPAGLAGAITYLLSDERAATAMGERGRQVFEEQAGATARTVTALRAVLGEDLSRKSEA